MSALIYLGVAVCLGDKICRRFYRFISLPHRWAAAFLVGLLASSWFTYLVAWIFGRALQPLLWGNLLFLIAATAALTWPRWKHKIIKTAPSKTQSRIAADLYLSRPGGSDKIDWVLIGAYFAFASWMMFASLYSTHGNLRIANNEYSDFGPNTAIMQSFALGHNFPTEYPHFSGDRIRYHFLYYFQAGNLEFLGLDPAWSLNLLSILSLVAMLVLVMVFGDVLFNSRAVGRVGSALFFFFGSLSYIPFLQKQGSLGAAIHNIRSLRDFLPSIFPYRGELWGVWSQVTFLNQRHLASAVGMLLLVLIFLVLRYRALPRKQTVARWTSIKALLLRLKTLLLRIKDLLLRIKTLLLSLARFFAGADESSETSPPSVASAHQLPAASLTPEANEPAPISAETFRASLPGFIFSGVLLGLLPMWNSAVFIAAAAVLAFLFILCPLRRQMLVLATTAGVIALPQIIYLSAGSGRRPLPHLIHWGYTLDNPTISSVASYLGFTFGFKWLLIALAIVFATGLQRRIFVAISSLILVAFVFQFTVEVLANQKFLHIWLIIANLFAAYGLWHLWHLSLGRTTLPGKLTAVLLVILIVPGGIIDFFPIHNAYWSQVTYRNDRLIDWLNKETRPRDIFLTDRFVSHPILMTGRRVFYGWPYYGWSAGYDADERDRVYRELFESMDPVKVYGLLKKNGIAYVAIDNAVRHGEFIKRPNEQVYANYFPKVFEDNENRYNSLTIYKVPEKTPSKFSSLPKFTANMFEGGKGAAPGQFDLPHGIAVDKNGNILVADTNNGRIEKFSPSGVFITSMGMKGAGYGQLGDPNGIAIDRAGNIYVTEASNHRVQKLTADGTFVSEWRGPDPGFYGPRKIAIGPDDSIYVVDQGRTRIVKFSPDWHALATWGRKGNGDGEFDDPTSVAVDPTNNKVYVADPRNKRIQVFDSTGKFLSKWSVPEWQRLYGFEDLAIDSKAGRLYASSANMDAVLVFDLNGRKTGSLKSKLPDKLDGPSALALVNGKLYVLCMFGNRVSEINLETK